MLTAVLPRPESMDLAGRDFPAGQPLLIFSAPRGAEPAIPRGTNLAGRRHPQGSGRPRVLRPEMLKAPDGCAPVAERAVKRLEEIYHMEETLERLQRQEKVTIDEPAEGWSPESYRRELDEYVAAHGRAPQTVTMHPDTMEALGLSAELGDPTADADTPLVVTSRDYDRATITLYY